MAGMQQAANLLDVNGNVEGGVAEFGNNSLGRRADSVCLLGIDAAHAFERYLAFGEARLDPRHIEHRRRELLREVLASGRRLDAGETDDGA